MLHFGGLMSAEGNQGEDETNIKACFGGFFAIQKMLGDTSGDTLYWNSVPSRAFMCNRIMTCKLLMYNDLLHSVATTCNPLHLWKNETQNPPRATSWGFDPPSRHQ
jgi:hypothetical protein